MPSVRSASDRPAYSRKGDMIHFCGPWRCACQPRTEEERGRRSPARPPPITSNLPTTLHRSSSHDPCMLGSIAVGQSERRARSPLLTISVACIADRPRTVARSCPRSDPRSMTAMAYLVVVLQRAVVEVRRADSLPVPSEPLNHLGWPHRLLVLVHLTRSSVRTSRTLMAGVLPDRDCWGPGRRHHSYVDRRASPVAASR